MPRRCGYIGRSSVSVGLGGVWWGVIIGCGAIYFLRGSRKGGAHGTRKLLIKVSVSKSRVRTGGP